jgi:hypothetical protein
MRLCSMKRNRIKISSSACTKFGIPRKLVGIIKMCLGETCCTVCIGKNVASFLFRMA